MLADAFKGVSEKILSELTDAYRAEADRRFQDFIVGLSTPSLTGRIGYDRTKRGGIDKRFFGWRRSVHVEPPPEGRYERSVEDWDDARRAHSQGRLSVSYVAADNDAKDQYETARDNFVVKNTQKIANVLGARSDLKDATTTFRFNRGVFEGSLAVVLSDARFRGEVSLKYVIRTIPNVTPYFQYPLVFTHATVGSAEYNRPSEEELRIALGATKTVAEEKREAEAGAGFCPMGGQGISAELYAPVARMMMPYVRCPACGSSVSAQRGVFRKHLTPEAEKRERGQKLLAAGYCPQSKERVAGHLIPPGNSYDAKIACESCGQQVKIEISRPSPDWSKGGALTGTTRATYQKHKLKKA